MGMTAAAESDRYEIITDIASLRALEADWQDLAARCPAHRFSQSFAWCLATWDAVEAPQGHRLHAVVARNAGRLVLVWPSVIRRRFPAREAHILGTSFAEYPSVLVEDGPEADRRIDTAWRLLRATSRCDIMAMHCVLAGTPLHRVLAAERRARVVEVIPTFAVAWDEHPTWDSYVRPRLARHSRRHGGKSRRSKLEQRGKLAFEPVDEPAACTALIAWTISQKLAQLAKSGRRGPWLETTAYRDLLVAAARGGSAAGRLVVFALTLDGRPIATHMTRVDRVRVEGINTVFDDAYAKYGPGQILTESCLNWAFEQGLEFDFLGFELPYKVFWANRKRDAFGYRFANSLWGAVYSGGRARLGQLKRGLWQGWRRRMKAVPCISSPTQGAAQEKTP